MDWFLYDKDLHYERVTVNENIGISLTTNVACPISSGTISGKTNLAFLSGSSTEKPAKRCP